MNFANKIGFGKGLNSLLNAENGWTGGQYSIFRLIFGIYLAIHFAMLAPYGAELFSSAGALADRSDSPLIHAFPNMFALWDGPLFVTSVLWAATVFALLFALGVRDRVFSILLWYIWACLFGRNPLISNPGLPYVGLLLFVHTFLPSAPYGSFDRRKDPDPNNGWRLPQELFVVVWILMAAGYTYSGYTKLVSPSWVDGDAFAYVLNSPLARPSFIRDLLLMMPDLVINLLTWGALAAEILFLPLSLLSRSRPMIWFNMLMMHLGLIVLVNFADLSLGMVMLHLFTFNPAWIKRKESPHVDRVFYDGYCGLCHHAVRFLLAEDARDNDKIAFRFAPLQGDLFVAAVGEDVRATLPDSMVVLTGDGDVLIRSSAWLRILERLGGIWKVLALALRLVPRAVLDQAYDLVASVRGKLFKKQEDACPILPKELRARFDY